jgi:hypothetical protein
MSERPVDDVIEPRPVLNETDIVHRLPPVAERERDGEGAGGNRLQKK